MSNQFKKVKPILVKALLENKRKAIREMRDAAGGRCCLCVIQDALAPSKAKARDYTRINSASFCSSSEAHGIFNRDTFAGPYLEMMEGKLMRVVAYAADLNDGNEKNIPPLPHKLIAEIVDNMDVRHPKWSFYIEGREIKTLPHRMTIKQAQKYVNTK
jgi:hypothetical protein